MTAFPAYLRPHAPDPADTRPWEGHILFGDGDPITNCDEMYVGGNPFPVAAPRPAREPQHPALLPCPFCAGEATMQENRGWESEDRFHVECASCGVSFGYVEDERVMEELEYTGKFLNATEAALAWNRRPKIRATRGKKA